MHLEPCRIPDIAGITESVDLVRYLGDKILLFGRRHGARLAQVCDDVLHNLPVFFQIFVTGLGLALVLIKHPLQALTDVLPGQLV